MNKSNKLVIIAMLIAMIVAIPQATAFGTYMAPGTTPGTFEATYPSANGSRIDACNLCHNSPAGGDARNPYGLDFQASVGTDAGGHNFSAIESLDSDGDSFTNIAEINALTFPGNESDHPLIPPTGGFNVSGFKLNSTDNTGLQGWTINISNATINMQNVTDVNGSYMFSGLSNGTYTLTENPMTGWTNVSPSTIEVTVDGADVPNQNFTNMPTVVLPYVVSGFKLNSSDNTGLQGWTINISNDTINMQGVTDVNGFYMFSGLSNGTYNISENPMAGWTNVSPSTIEVTVDGADVPNQNFTNMMIPPPPSEVAYIVIIPYSVSLHTGEELQFHAQAYDANDTKIDANISFAIKYNRSKVGNVTESGLFSALKRGSVRVTASSGDISDTATVTVTNIDHRQRHGNRHHNDGGWQE